MLFTRSNRAWLSICLLVALLAQLALMQLAFADDDHDRERRRDGEHARSQPLATTTFSSITRKDDQDEDADEDRDDDAATWLVAPISSSPAPSSSTASGSTTAASGSTTSPAPSTTTQAVTISGDQFQPRSVTVKAGTTVTWTNNDADAHTSTSTSGVWDSRRLSQGQAYSFTFNQAGTFDYVCAFHSGMRGSIVVTP